MSKKKGTKKRKTKKELEEEVKELQDRLLRTMAEIDNIIKRYEKEKKEIVEYANFELISKLVEVVDNFERALNSNADYESFRKGIDIIYKQFVNILQNEGLKQIDALNKEFDPYWHEAIDYEEREDVPPNINVEEFQKGYIFKSKVIRPSKVKVSKEVRRNE